MRATTQPGANHIYSMRRNRSLLQKHLATLLGHRSYRRVSHYESGTAFPPFLTAILLEIALGARLSELYPELYQRCQALVVERAQYLPDHARRPLVGRLLEKDQPHEHPGTS